MTSNAKFLHGPGVVQLLHARGLSLQEHLPAVLAQIAQFSKQGGDPLLAGRYIVGWVAALDAPAPDAAGGEAWCGAVESMLAHTAPQASALVVESDPVQRRYAATVLTRAGMTVNAVDHVDGAWLSNTLHYDFILIDHDWPSGRGSKLAEAIRCGQGPNTETYILGSSATLAQRECMASGMDAFVQKPIDLATLKMRALRAASGTLTVSSVP